MATLTMEQFAKKVNRWTAGQKKTLEIALRKATDIVHAEAAAKHLSGPKMPKGVGSATTATLQPHTGDLRGATHTKVNVSGKEILAQVINNMKYARVHEYGYPKRGIPERSFLRSSLEAKRKAIVELVGDEIVEAYKKS